MELLSDALVVVHFGGPFHSCDSSELIDPYLEEHIGRRVRQYHEADRPVVLIEPNGGTCPAVQQEEQEYLRIAINETLTQQFDEAIGQLVSREVKYAEICGLYYYACINKFSNALLESAEESGYEIVPCVNRLLTDFVKFPSG